MTSGLDALRLGPDDALFLDFDGTLADIGPDPDVIALPPGTDDALVRLAVRLGGALAVLSGRDVRDLARRTPTGLWRAGGHGIEILAPGAVAGAARSPMPEAALARLRAAAAIPGVRLELKGPLAALHFRAVPSAGEACLAAAEAAAAELPGYVRQAGKMVVEVKPAEAHKGAALRRLAAAPPFARRRPVFVGDDATDEDAIAAAQDLGGLGVKVGEGATAARLRAADPAEVLRWLAREAG